MNDTPTGKYNLTEGSVLGKILQVAFPIMASQLLQMAYNLTDIFWLGRVGSLAVAASAAAGLYMWLAVGFMLVGRMGAEIGAAQSFGRKDAAAALTFTQNALFLNALLGLAFTAAFILAAAPLARFFPVSERAVTTAAAAYLRIIGIGILPTFLAAPIIGAFNGAGNARTPFIINAAGLLCNAALDPLLIFTLDMGVEGAAIATIIAETLVFVLILAAVRRRKSSPFTAFPLRLRVDAAKIRRILAWAVPLALESIAFCFLTMLCSRMEARFGASALAAGKIGAQIESLTWMLGGGFGSALVAFIGQNHGAGLAARIRSGVRVSLMLMAIWGVVATVFLCTAGRALFYLFLPDSGVAGLGRSYCLIFAFCQIPMNLEAVASGAFKGSGRTIPPALVSIAANCLKPFLAGLLARTSYGLLGIWAAVSAADVLRGVALLVWYGVAARKRG